MRVLLDENLPHVLRNELPGHAVFTVRYMRWDGMNNGALLAAAAAAGFDVMITMDSGVNYQQNLVKLPIAILILQAASNDIDDLRPLIPQLLANLQSLASYSVTRLRA